MWRRLAWINLVIMATAMPCAGAPQDPAPPPPPVLGKKITAPLPGNDPHSALLKAFFEDIEPDLLFGTLVTASIWRALTLPGLVMKDIPEAWKAYQELKRFPEYNRKLRSYKKAAQSLRRQSPALLAEVKQASDTYAESEKGLTRLLEKLRALESVKKNKTAQAELENAIQLWANKQDTTQVEEWVSRYRSRRSMSEVKAWAKGYDQWKATEKERMETLVESSNRLIAALNQHLSETEKIPSLSPHASGKRRPGQLFYPWGPIRPGETVQYMSNRCELMLAALRDKILGLYGKAGASGIFGQGHAILMPIGSLVFTGSIGYFTVWAFNHSIRKYGKAPQEVRAERAKNETVKNEVAVKAEASLDGQIANRRSELKPFTDLVTQTLQDHQFELFARLKELNRNSPRGPVLIDWKRKSEIFANEGDLAYQVLQAIPYAAQSRIGKDLTFDQLLKLLSLPPSDEKIRLVQQRFLTAVYTRLIDNLFPELEGEIEVGDNMVTVGAGHIIGPTLRNALVAETLPKMQNMKLKVPANVPAHPAIPLPVVPVDTSAPQSSPSPSVTATSGQGATASAAP